MKMKLGQLAVFRGGSAFPQNQQGNAEGDLPFMKVSDLSHGTGAWKTETANNWLTAEQSDAMKPTIAPPSSTVFAKIGEGLKNERCRLITRPTAIDNNMMAAIPTEFANAEYLYFLIKTIGLRKYAVGSALPYIRQSNLMDIEVDVPTPENQRSIAAVLGSFDDKIAANTNLASVADEWVRAEYDLLTTLGSEHRALSEIVIHRRNIANPELLEVKVPYVGLEHIPRRLMWLAEHGTSDEVSSNKSHFKSGDILFGKLRPYFHKIVTAPKSGICSTDVLVLTPMDEALSGFALASLAHDGVVQAVTSASEGTRMPRTSWKDLSSINVPWPGHEVAASFSTRVSAIRDYVIGLMAENQTLAVTRDALLPQLMSGKLHVKDAEALVESVV